jgi:hypothetical protein
MDTGAEMPAVDEFDPSSVNATLLIDYVEVCGLCPVDLSVWPLKHRLTESAIL